MMDPLRLAHVHLSWLLISCGLEVLGRTLFVPSQEFDKGFFDFKRLNGLISTHDRILLIAKPEQPFFAPAG
jgi:hypothetical protein